MRTNPTLEDKFHSFAIPTTIAVAILVATYVTLSEPYRNPCQQRGVYEVCSNGCAADGHSSSVLIRHPQGWVAYDYTWETWKTGSDAGSRNYYYATRYIVRFITPRGIEAVRFLEDGKGHNREFVARAYPPNDPRRGRARSRRKEGTYVVPKKRAPPSD